MVGHMSGQQSPVTLFLRVIPCCPTYACSPPKSLMCLGNTLEGVQVLFLTLTHTPPRPQGSFRELVYVFIMLTDAGLSPDLHSYAAALQCMGRRDQDAHTIQRWVRDVLGGPALPPPEC